MEFTYFYGRINVREPRLKAPQRDRVRRRPTPFGERRDDAEKGFSRPLHVHEVPHPQRIFAPKHIEVKGARDGLLAHALDVYIELSGRAPFPRLLNLIPKLDAVETAVMLDVPEGGWVRRGKVAQRRREEVIGRVRLVFVVSA